MNNVFLQYVIHEPLLNVLEDLYWVDLVYIVPVLIVHELILQML